MPNINLVFFTKKIYTLTGDTMELFKLKEEYTKLLTKINDLGRSL